MTIGDTRLESRSEEFRIGRVVSRTFDLLFAHPVMFLTLSALLSIPLVLFDYYQGSRTQGAAQAGNAFVVGILVPVLVMIWGFLAQAALTKGAISSLNDEKPGIADSLSAMIKNALPLSIIAILLTFGIVLGAILLIVPGLILMTMWAVAVPVRVVEHTDIIETFSRSRALTREYRGSIFLLFLAFLVLAAGAMLLARLPLGVGLVPKAGDFTAVYAVTDWIERTIVGGITAVGTASIYYELRFVKEGLGAQQMAAAFD